MVLKCFFGVFVFISIACLAECFFGIGRASASVNQGVSGSVSARAKLSLSGLISKILEFPLSFLKDVFKAEYKVVFKLPIELVKAIVKTVLTIVEHAGKIDADVIKEIIKFIEDFLADIVEVLVNVGVLEGKTTEDVMNGIYGLLKNIVEFAIKLETKISSGVVSTIEKIISSLNIKEIIAKILSLPIIKQLKYIFDSIRDYFEEKYKTQIADFKAFIKKLIEEHKDFFYPLANNVSSRILIISNALHALIDGQLDECPGYTGPEKSPSANLQWELGLLVDKVEIFILRVLGLQKLADEIQAKAEGKIGTPIPIVLNASIGGW